MLCAAGVSLAAWSCPSVAGTTTLRVYFNNAQLAATTNDCAMVFEVRREVPQTLGVAAAALRQLFAGPSAAERAAGYRSPFSPATAGLLRNVFVTDGTAYVDLNDPRTLLPGATSSCGAAEFNTAIERTVLQFPTVSRVILAIEGDPKVFYEWMGRDCDQTNDQCSSAPFRHHER